MKEQEKKSPRRLKLEKKNRRRESAAKSRDAAVLQERLQVAAEQEHKQRVETEKRTHLEAVARAELLKKQLGLHAIHSAYSVTVLDALAKANSFKDGMELLSHLRQSVAIGGLFFSSPADLALAKEKMMELGLIHDAFVRKKGPLGKRISHHAKKAIHRVKRFLGFRKK